MWFSVPSLVSLSDAGTYARGLQVFLAQKVLALDVEHLDGDRWVLNGLVQGTERKPYRTEVELSLMPDGVTVDRWHSHCSCPVGLQCKHAVALLIKAAYQGQGTGSASAPVALSPQERKQQQAEKAQKEALAAQQRLRQAQVHQAERWLQAGLVGGAGPLGAKVLVPDPRQTESPMYLLYQSKSHERWAPLRVCLGVSSPKVKGGWSKPRAVSVHHFRDVHMRYNGKAQQLEAVDHELLDLLGALPTGMDAYGYRSETDKLLNGVAAWLVLTRAASTGRLFWREDGGGLGPALSLGPEVPLQWQWTQQTSPAMDEPLWQLQPLLPDAHTVLCTNQPQLLYVNLSAGRVGQVVADATALPLLQAPPLPQSVMLRHQGALVRRLGAVAPMPPVLSDFKRVGGTPLWRLHVSRVPDAQPHPDAPAPGWMTAQLDFDYQGHQGWWPADAPPQVMLNHEGERVLLVRDVTSETHAVTQLRQLGLLEWDEGVFALAPEVSQTQWLMWADTQFQPLKDAGFQLTLDAELNHWVRHAGDMVVDFTPQGGDDDEAAAVSDWFDLSLGLEVDGQRINVLPWLPQLIQSLRSGAAQDPNAIDLLPPHIYLPAPDGQGFVRVATAPLQPWLLALLELFDDLRADFQADSLRLSRFDALRTSVALGEGATWDGAQHLRQLAQQLQGRAELPATPKPAGLVADMRPYQQHGLDWLQFLRAHGLAGILADDMGLGKTLQTLAHIQAEKEAGRLDRPALVVAPVSLMGNWQREAARFCPELRTLVLHGSDRHDRADDMAHAHLVIAPYSLLHRDRERWLHQPWHLVVLDEAQNIKNANTQAAQVVTELNTRHRLCLSGTPIENHLGEVWSLFHFLMPGFLGSQAKFQQRFRTPIEKHGDSERLAQLRARLTPFILRRTKQLVAHELPPKVESVMTVELDGKQADLYETIRLSMEKAVRDAIADKGLAKSQIVFLDALLKLRQVCCDPRLVKTPAWPRSRPRPSWNN